MKVNTKNWKEFQVDEIFEINRGKRLISNEQIAGDTPYISSSKFNNGIDNYINPPNYMETYNNALTLSNSGSVGYCFYHNYDFVASDHCTVLKIKTKKLSLELALFLMPILETLRPKYGFEREINNERLKKEFIKLPVKKNREIDWGFMENYIKDISKNIIYNKKVLKQKKKTELASSWKDFKLIDIFNIKKGERLTENDRVFGEIPLITASAYNNGITSLINFDTFKDLKKIFKNKITIDMFGNVFYQDFEYFSDDNVHTLLFKDKEYEKYYENKYINLFLVSIIKQISKKYGFGRQVRLQRLEKEILSFPVTEDGGIDFKFMEKYIKSLPYSFNLE